MKHQDQEDHKTNWANERFTIKLDENFCHLAGAGDREAGLQKYS